jgi:hypothetical protein
MTSILNIMFTIIAIPLKLQKKSAEDYPTDVIDMMGISHIFKIDDRYTNIDRSLFTIIY